MLRSAAIVFLTAALIAGLASQRGETPGLTIANVTVIDATGAAPVPRTVVVRGDVIAELLPADAATPGGTTAIDGRGRFLIPGLWDMHVHLGTQDDATLAESLMLPQFLAHGVVGVRDMGGPPDRVFPLRDRVRAGTLQGPRILTPGPFIDGTGDADPMFRRVARLADVEPAIRDLATAGADFLKVQANLSREIYDGIIRTARARKIVVAGHVPVAIAASDVVAAGQRSIEHISPALVGDAGLLFGCSSREAELRAELLALEKGRASTPRNEVRTREAALRRRLIESFDPAKAAALGRAIRERGVWIVPTMVWSNTLRPLSPSDDGADASMDALPAEMRQRWTTARQQYLKTATPEAFAAAAAVAAASAKAVKALHAAGAPVLAGTDAFDAFVLPGSSLHKELALLVGAGLSPLQALQAATRNAADYRGDLDREGTIENGKRADLVLLDANPLDDIRNIGRVQTVILGGRVVRDKKP